MSDRSDRQLSLLADALERAVVVARRDAGRPDAPPPPPALGPVLRFARLPPRAMRTVRDVLDADEAFRARVVEGLEEGQLDRASWLFLARPDGWDEELALAEDAALEERQQADVEARLDDTRRRVEQLEASLAEVRVERDELASQRSQDQRSLRELRSELDGVRSGAEGAAARAERLDQERTKAVRELQVARELAARRLTELRDREQQAASAPAPERSPVPAESTDVHEHGAAAERAPDAPAGAVPDAEVSAVVAAAVAEAGARVADAAQTATDLAGALEALADVLSPARVSGSGPPSAVGSGGAVASGGAVGSGGAVAPGRGSGSDVSGRSRRALPPRRSPLRLRRGVRDDSAEAVEQLLAVEGLVAFVDGYNVTMERWPALDKAGQRRALMAALGALVARFDASIHVVFDGDSDGTRPSVAAPLPVRVHFSSQGEEADDRILDLVASLPTDRPVLVVSSDRAVAEGARRLGANAARSSQLIGAMER